MWVTSDADYRRRRLRTERKVLTGMKCNKVNRDIDTLPWRRELELSARGVVPQLTMTQAPRCLAGGLFGHETRCSCRKGLLQSMLPDVCLGASVRSINTTKHFTGVSKDFVAHHQQAPTLAIYPNVADLSNAASPFYSQVRGHACPASLMLWSGRPWRRQEGTLLVPAVSMQVTV